MAGLPIAIDGLAKAFGPTRVIEGLSATFAGGEFTVILGPSGCGKSTLLNMIAGLEAVGAGTIRIGGREVQDLPPKDRGCAMVFQNYALYPHMSVAENIGYALKVAGTPRAERARRVHEAARVVELTDLLARRPSELSGGQRQRVAIARAIVRAPQVLLFDEPLSNLDAKLRHGMRMELAALHRQIGATSVFVTHDQVEAMTLADRVLILNQGRVEQFDTPEAIYHRPASTFVAGFIGAPPMNLMPVTGRAGMLHLDCGTALCAHPLQGTAILGIRPEQIVLGQGGVDAQIIYREDLGSHSTLLARLAGGQQVQIATPVGAAPGTGASAIGPATLLFPPQHLHFFDPQTGKRLLS